MSAADQLDYLQNIQIYIGNDENYENNSLCQGGPFLDIADSSNWFNDQFANLYHVTDPVW